jgi:hypothetical protein
MKNKIIIIGCLLIMTISSKSQMNNNNEEFYIDILEILLSEQTFKLNEMEIVWDNDTCIFFSRSDNFITDTEKRFEFKDGRNLIRVWPNDHIFFFDIKTYIKINEFHVLNGKAQIDLEIYYERKIKKRLLIVFECLLNKWQIKEVIKDQIPPSEGVE